MDIGIASPHIIDFTRLEDTLSRTTLWELQGLIATRKAKATDKYGGMRISSIGVKPGWENSKYKVERGFRFLLLRITYVHP